MCRPEIDFLVHYDDQSLLAELRRIAELKRSDTVTKADLNDIGRISHSLLVRRFGSLRHALTRAGLRSKRFMKATDEELLGILIDLWQQTVEREGRTPQKNDLAKYGFSVSSDTITRRFGTWRKALVKAHDSFTLDSVEAVQPDGLSQNLRKRGDISIRKRFFVMKRDHFACVRCGASGYGVRLEVHHRFPFARGGTDSLANLETLCFDCNRGQRDNIV